MLRPVALVTSSVRVLTLVAAVAALGSAAPVPALAGPFLLPAPPPVPVPAARAPSGQGMVAVVKSPDADGACQEIVTRIVAELMADGVSVVALTCPMAAPACVAGSGARVSAIVLVQVRNNVRAVEVHAANASSPGKLIPAHATSPAGRVRRVADADTGGGPAALAVRTVEVLRAMLVEGADIAPRPIASGDSPAAATVRARPVSPAPLAEDQDPPAEPARALVAVGPANVTMAVGAAMFAGFDGLNPAFGPALTVGRRTADHVMLSLALAGPAFGRDQGNAAGRVSVRHEMAALQADLLGLFLRRFVLRVGIGAGVYHISINGRPPQDVGLPVGAAPPGTTFVVGRNTGALSGLLSWSAGVVANLRPHIGVFLDGRMFVLTPTPVVSLSGLEVGRVGNPQISLSAGLEFRL